MPTRVVNAPLLLEEEYVASHRYEGVANGSTVYMYVENPSNSDVTMNILALEVASTGSGRIDMYRDVTVLSQGSEVPILNLRFDRPTSPKTIIRHGGSYSFNTPSHSTVLPGGTRVRILGSISEIGEKIKIPKGYNTLIAFTNVAGVDTDVSIRMLWKEVHD